MNTLHSSAFTHGRRSFLTSSAAASLSLLLFSSGLSSCKTKNTLKPLILPPGAGFDMRILRNHVGVFTERGGTIGFMANGQGTVVVDTQFPDQALHLVDMIRSMSDHAFDAVINTHHHGDHTSGNPIFKELTQKIIAHENSRKNQMASAKANGTEEQIQLPNTTFKNNYVETIGGESVKMDYFGPAHTDGDIVVHFENANIAHVGDLVFNRRFPYIDKGAGAQIANWVLVLDTIDKKYDNDTQFIFGHCNEGYDVVGGKEDIKAFKNYLERLLEFTRKCITNGLSCDQAIALGGSIPGAEEWTGKGIDRSFKAAYEELLPK